MVQKSDEARPQGGWSGLLQEELGAARAALAAGDCADAERRAKAISLLARAARDVAELARLDREEPQDDDVDQIRAELFARLAEYEAQDRREAGLPE